MWRRRCGCDRGRPPFPDQEAVGEGSVTAGSSGHRRPATDQPRAHGGRQPPRPFPPDHRGRGPPVLNAGREGGNGYVFTQRRLVEVPV